MKRIPKNNRYNDLLTHAVTIDGLDMNQGTSDKPSIFMRKTLSRLATRDLSNGRPRSHSIMDITFKLSMADVKKTLAIEYNCTPAQVNTDTELYNQLKTLVNRVNKALAITV